MNINGDQILFIVMIASAVLTVALLTTTIIVINYLGKVRLCEI